MNDLPEVLFICVHNAGRLVGAARCLGGGQQVWPPDQPGAAAPTDPGGMTVIEANKSVVRRLVAEVFNGGRLEVIGSGIITIVNGKSIDSTNLVDIEDGLPISVGHMIVHILSRGDVFNIV